ICLYEINVRLPHFGYKRRHILLFSLNKETISKKEQNVLDYMNRVYQKLEERDAHETEFLQAAKLLFQSLIPVFVKNNTYIEYKDRKSTRLNSSHVSISYAVFCLK